MSDASGAGGGILGNRLIKDNLWPLAAVAGATIALAIGWELFAERLATRTGEAGQRGAEVARVWGGPLLQPQPTFQWRRADAATVDLTLAEAARSDVQVDLDVQYRRRGMAEYPCYEASLKGTWDFQNPSTEPVFVAFALGLPVERDALMLRDLSLTVDGREDPQGTEYAPERVIWTGRVEGGKAARVQVTYRGRGQGRFGYRLGALAGDAASVRPVSGFRLALSIAGAPGELDFPLGSMSPTADREEGGRRVLVWEVDRLLTSFDIGIELPDNRAVAAALARLTSNAPWFFLMFAGGLLWALSRVRQRARAVHVLGLSAAYFLYFPLAAYLTAYIPWAYASTAALVGVSALGITHSTRFAGAKAGLAVGLCLVFFLAVPSVAYLVPAHTGLILVVASLAVLAVGLQALGGVARRLEIEESIEPPQRPAPAAPPAQAPAPVAEAQP